MSKTSLKNHKLIKEQLLFDLLTSVFLSCHVTANKPGFK